jgi:hypothetical protein
VLDLVSWVRIAVLMNVYLGLGNSEGSGFWNEGYMSQGREMEGLVYEQPEDKVFYLNKQKHAASREI